MSCLSIVPLFFYGNKNNNWDGEQNYEQTNVDRKETEKRHTKKKNQNSLLIFKFMVDKSEVEGPLLYNEFCG